MASVFSYDCENGSNGSNVTTGLSGFTAISGTTPKYSNSWARDGSLSIDFNTTSATSQCRLTLSPTLARPYVRVYLQLTGLPSGNTSLLQAYKSSGGTFLCEVQVTSAGKIRLRNSSFVAVATSTHTFSAGDEVRVEWDPNPGTSNTQTLRLFYGANLDGATPDETLTGATGTAGNVEWLIVGVNSSATWHFRADAIGIDNATWLGPVGVPTDPPAGTGLVFFYDAENGTDGATVNPALSGFAVIGGVAPTFSDDWSADGSLCLDWNTTSAYGSCRVVLSPTVPRPYVRVYAKLVSLPSGNLTIVSAYKSSGATLLAEVQATSAGKIRLRNAASSTVATSTHTFSAGDEVRLEWDPNPGVSNTQTLRMFWGANVDGDTADETLTGGTGTAGDVEWLLLGVCNAATMHLQMDSVAVSDTTWVGPAAGGGGVDPGTPTPVGGLPFKVWDAATSSYVETDGLRLWDAGSGDYLPTSGFSDLHIWDGQQYLPVTTTLPPQSGRFPGDPGQGNFYLDITHDNTVSGGYSGQLAGIHARLSAYSPAKTRRLSLHRMYNTGLAVNATEFNWALTNNMIPLPSFKASPTSVTSGSQDGALSTIASLFLSAKASGKAVWWTYYHEPEDNFTTSTAAAQVRAAARYIKQFFDDAGCSNCAFVAVLYMAGWTLNPSSGRDWRWWWPDWKGTSTGGSSATNPNPADFYPRGSTDAVVDILGLDSYQYDTWYPGQALSKWAGTWEGDTLATWRSLITQASGTAYPICIGETGYYCKATGTFTSGSGKSGVGWTPSTFYDSDTQAMLNALLPAYLANDVVGVSLWNQYVPPPNGAIGDYRDTRLSYADPNELRWKALANMCDSATWPPVGYAAA